LLYVSLGDVVDTAGWVDVGSTLTEGMKESTVPLGDVASFSTLESLDDPPWDEEEDVVYVSVEAIVLFEVDGAAEFEFEETEEGFAVPLAESGSVDVRGLAEAEVAESLPVG
jgi:hypothetical protein